MLAIIALILTPNPPITLNWIRLNPLQWGKPQTSNIAHTHDTDYAEQEVVAAHAETRPPPKQRAADWLAGVAAEEDDVKDMILQDLWKKEGFQDAWTHRSGWGLLNVIL